MCPPMWAHWHHLANTIEQSVCGGDAVLCQITLSTCLCMLPVSVVQSSSGMLTIGRIAYRGKGDRSAQRGRIVIYDCVVVSIM